MKKKIAVLISGGGSNLQALIEGSNKENSNYEIVLVISNRKDAYGLTRAHEAGIKNKIIRQDDSAIIQECKQENVDLIVLAGYLAIVSDELIKEYKNRIINIHPSLIPSFCGHRAYGIHVHEMALQRGVKVTGATVHFVSEIVDGGPILLQEACNIDDLNTAEQIQARVLEIEHRIIVKAVELFCDNKIKFEEERAIVQ